MGRFDSRAEKSNAPATLGAAWPVRFSLIARDAIAAIAFSAALAAAISKRKFRR
jgi:hypothetical protein